MALELWRYGTRLAAARLAAGFLIRYTARLLQGIGAATDFRTSLTVTMEGKGERCYEMRAIPHKTSSLVVRVTLGTFCPRADRTSTPRGSEEDQKLIKH